MTKPAEPLQTWANAEPVKLPTLEEIAATVREVEDLQNAAAIETARQLSGCCPFRGARLFTVGGLFGDRPQVCMVDVDPGGVTSPVIVSGVIQGRDTLTSDEVDWAEAVILLASHVGAVVAVAAFMALDTNAHTVHGCTP